MASIFKQAYTIKNKNGKRVRKKSKFWYVDYKAADGTRKRLRGFKDKTATAQLAAKLEREAEQAQIGIVDRYKDYHKKPLVEHLVDFRASLLAKGNTVQYVEQTLNRITPVFEACKFVYWKDIDASAVQKHLADMRGKKDGIGEQTSNYYLQGIKQFCRWMVRNQRASESPVEHLGKVNVKRGHRARRAFEPDELRSLLEAAESGPERFKATGRQRAVLYRFAAETGLRAKELRSLTVSSFDFEKHTVTVRADDAKNSIESILPLRADTAELMRTFLADKLPGTRALAMPCKYRMADMIRADCKDAGIDCEDSGQGKIDFHSLRHTTGSLLAASGVHPKVAQSIMRHSDINLTMSRYTHIFRGQESEAVAKLPDFSLPSKQSQKATGTDGATVGSAYKPA
ncbi:MAG: site-specific integrase [Phycisphaerales bacterium]|nr:MAG: site-specific integrase [Phycisphaerales bacterium]